MNSAKAHANVRAQTTPLAGQTSTPGHAEYDILALDVQMLANLVDRPANMVDLGNVRHLAGRIAELASALIERGAAHGA